MDALGSVAGGGTSSSASQIFVESATGIGAGARTGFANVVTGALFLVAIFLSPLVTIVPFEAVAPAMVFVGFLMIRQAVNIDWNDWGLGIPAFMGRGKEVHWLMYVVSAVFLIFFANGLITGWMH